MKQFLTSPLPRNAGVVQCYIRRNKSGTNKLFPVYSLYLKVGTHQIIALLHFALPVNSVARTLFISMHHIMFSPALWITMPP
jgi:hypothetical protein